jgi:hypothetical protein
MNDDQAKISGRSESAPRKRPRVWRKPFSVEDLRNADRYNCCFPETRSWGPSPFDDPDYIERVMAHQRLQFLQDAILVLKGWQAKRSHEAQRREIATLKEYLDGVGLTPNAPGVASHLDRKCRDELLARMPDNKLETRLQGALQEPLYALPELGDVALSFTYPSKVFLIETRIGSEITFEPDEAFDHVPAADRAELTSQFELTLYGARTEKATLPHFS